jgi:hypothetical protein
MSIFQGSWGTDLPDFPSAADLVGKEGFAAKRTSNTYDLCGGVEASFVGVITHAMPGVGGKTSVRGYGECLVKCGGTVTALGLMAVDTDDEFIAATSGMTPVGRFMADGVDQDYVRAVIFHIADESVA